MALLDYGPITVRRETVNGRDFEYLVGEWPERTTFTGGVLRDAHPSLLRKDGDRVVVTLHGASAVYRIEREDFARDLFECVRES